MRRLALAGALIGSLILCASGCGSSASDKQRFADGVRPACTNYLHALNQLGRSTSAKATERDVALSIKASETWMRELRPLTPPTSSGVSIATWQHTIDLQLADQRAFARFHKTEYPKLLASFKQPHPTPKLPPGTGPTAATLAQAFNSPEGRRYLRLQRAFTARTTVHGAAWMRVAKKVGLLKICRAVKRP